MSFPLNSTYKSIYSIIIMNTLNGVRFTSNIVLHCDINSMKGVYTFVVR